MEDVVYVHVNSSEPYICTCWWMQSANVCTKWEEAGGIAAKAILLYQPYKSTTIICWRITNGVPSYVHCYQEYGLWLMSASFTFQWVMVLIGAQSVGSCVVQMDSIASFTVETGGQKYHVMWILSNQQAAWWCHALELPSEKMLWNPSIAEKCHFHGYHNHS